MYFSIEQPPKTKDSVAEFDGVVRVDEIVIRKTQREEKERALLLVTDMFERERERESMYHLRLLDFLYVQFIQCVKGNVGGKLFAPNYII